MRQTSQQPRITDPVGYPTSEWTAQRVKYSQYWWHFDGYWLDDTIGDTDEPRYPLQMNPFNLACLLHAAFLFGEVRDGNDPLVTTVIEAWGNGGANAALTAKLSDIVNRVWHENHGRSLQTENGIISQVLGGCVFGTGFDPTRVRRGYLPVRVDRILPEFFFPVYSPNDYWDLLETFVTFKVSKRQAIGAYNISTDLEYPLYQEMWNRDRYEITVDGQIANWLGLRAEGKTPGNFVPFTYIPHIRAGEFWGTSLLDKKLGIAKEINDRYADLGDVMSENARRLPAIWNARTVGTKRMDNGMVLLDFGNQAPGIDSPAIAWPPGDRSSEASVSWAKELLIQARTDVYTPPSVYGMDSGSQRSQLSIAISMIPLIVHIRQERGFWTDGLNQIAWQILNILAEKTDEVTREEISNIKIRQEWSPTLPRDREALTNEMILRVSAGLISPISAMDRLGDIRDLKTEMNLIKMAMEEKAQMEAKSNPFAGAGAGGTQAGQSRPKTPQANVEKE